MVTIHPEILKGLRKRSGLSSQEALARASKVGVATIKRIEASEEAYEARSLVAERLAHALGVTVEALSGEPGENRKGERILRYLGYRQVKPLLDSDTALSCDVVEHLYGVPADRQIALAPLLFALMAEGSLAWRQEQIDAVDEAAKKLSSLSESARHLSFVANGDIDIGSGLEHESIAKRDVFGFHIHEDSYQKGYDPNETNPFADYLRSFAERVQSDDIQIDVGLDIIDGLPRYRIGEDLTEEMTGEDRLALYAMSRGHARMKDIPEALLGEDGKEDRIAWMVSRIPGKERKEFEEQEREFEALRKKVGIDLSGTTGDAPSPEPC